ncbi:hypothetical protein [Clostridium tunisiense]|uniref:hypothetical protein n=1 Tax=Clostridium tunisiense TaxID=219748 RepID=UPI0002F6DC5F|nr:hypothetical protein [Clostridium tunisiense]
MKSKDITIKNISLMLLILLSILMIVLEKNGITLMNNIYVYIYIAIYIGLSVTYVLLTNKTCNWLGIFVVVYLIFVCFSYLGSYESYKSPSNKNKLIVENKTVFLNSAKLTVSKGTCGIFKKELFQTSSTCSQGWSVFWKDDSSIILTGPAVVEFKDFYKNGVLDNHYINMIKESKIEILSSEGILINID